MQLTLDQRAFARRAVENGRLRYEADAVREVWLCGQIANGNGRNFF